MEVVFSVLLTISACYIANNVRSSTGKKQNTCLLTWHVFNLLILIIVTVFIAVYNLKQDPNFEDEDEDPNKYHYYWTVTELVSLNVKFYVDSFLLWLLYRFMKP